MSPPSTVPGCRPPRPPGGLPTRALLVTLVLLGSPAAARGQIRPLDPVDWGVMDRAGWTLEMGGGLYTGQRASLAGAEGRLLDLGSFAASWSLGRVALRLAGTAVRVFDDHRSFAGPIGGALPFERGRRRVDAGDYRVSTMVELTAPGSDVAALLRFGVRLPTTDNVKGLDRDRTDFFSSLAGRVVHHRWSLRAEAGLGVNGTRDPDNEQVDPFLFFLGGRWHGDRVQPFLELLGQHDTRPGPDQRGAENLGEARLGVRLGGDRWVRLAAIRGWTRMGPELGLEVRLGAAF